MSGNNLQPTAVAFVLPAVPLFLWSLVTNRLAERLLNPVKFTLGSRQIHVGDTVKLGATFEPRYSGRIRRVEAVLRCWKTTPAGEELVAELRSGEDEIHMSAGEDVSLEFAMAVPADAPRTETQVQPRVRWTLTCAAVFPLAGRWEWDDTERVTVYF